MPSHLWENTSQSIHCISDLPVLVPKGNLQKTFRRPGLETKIHNVTEFKHHGLNIDDGFMTHYNLAGVSDYLTAIHRFV